MNVHSNHQMIPLSLLFVFYMSLSNCIHLKLMPLLNRLNVEERMILFLVPFTIDDHLVNNCTSTMSNGYLHTVITIALYTCSTVPLWHWHIKQHDSIYPRQVWPINNIDSSWSSSSWSSSSSLEEKEGKLLTSFLLLS